MHYTDDEEFIRSQHYFYRLNLYGWSGKRHCCNQGNKLFFGIPRKLIDLNMHAARKIFMQISITAICCLWFCHLPVVFWVKLKGPLFGVFCTWKGNYFMAVLEIHCFVIFWFWIHNYLCIKMIECFVFPCLWPDIKTLTFGIWPLLQKILVG